MYGVVCAEMTMGVLKLQQLDGPRACGNGAQHCLAVPGTVAISLWVQAFADGLVRLKLAGCLTYCFLF